MLTGGRRDLEMEFEQPFRQLGFSGVPHRSTAFVMPTVNCLVRPERGAAPLPPPSSIREGFNAAAPMLLLRLRSSLVRA